MVGFRKKRKWFVSGRKRNCFIWGTSQTRMWMQAPPMPKTRDKYRTNSIFFIVKNVLRENNLQGNVVRQVGTVIILFIHLNGSPLTRDTFVKMVKEALKAANVDQTLYSGHSFRRKGRHS